MIATLTLMTVLSGAPSNNLYGLEQSAFEDAAFANVTSGGWVPVTKEMKALPAGARAAAVKALGTLVKTFVGSEAFKKRYAEWRTNGAPDAPKPIRTPAQIVAAERAEYQKTRKEQEEMLKSLPKDSAAEVRKSIEGMAQAQEAHWKDTETIKMLEQARFDGEKASVDEWNTAHPADFTPFLKAALTKKLENTEGVDFSAKLKDRAFAKAEYEAKNAEWKMCFRAGKEACEAARAFAKAWLADLK